MDNHEIEFSYNDDVIQLIADRCTELESGARIVDAILTNTVLPTISQEFLSRTMQGDSIKGIKVTVAESNFNYDFT